MFRVWGMEWCYAAVSAQSAFQLEVLGSIPGRCFPRVGIHSLRGPGELSLWFTLGKFHGVRGNTTRPSSVSGWSIGWEVWTGVGGSLFIKEAEDSGGGGGCEAGEDRETAKSTCREGTRDDAKEIFCASRDWPHRS